MSKRWRKVLELLDEHGDLTTQQLARKLEMSMNATYSLMWRMRRRRFVAEADRQHTGGVETVVWYITRSGRRHLPQKQAA